MATHIKNKYVKTMQAIKGTPPTILRAMPSVGLAVYDPKTKTGYLASSISEVKQPNRAQKTAEPLLKRLRHDTTDFSGLHAILVGDGIFAEEYAGNEVIDEEFSCYEACWRAHQKYRREIQEHLQAQGFKHIHPFFCQKQDLWTGILLNTNDGSGVIQEYNLTTKLVQKTIFFEYPYKKENIKQRNNTGNSRTQRFDF